jgi:hypothetical protein
MLSEQPDAAIVRAVIDEKDFFGPRKLLNALDEFAERRTLVVYGNNDRNERMQKLSAGGLLSRRHNR